MVTLSFKKLDALAARFEDKSQKAARVEVGFLSDMRSAKGESYAKIAFWNEFGVKPWSKRQISRYKSTSKDKRILDKDKGKNREWFIPPRPFFRTMINKEMGTWSAKIARGIRTTNLPIESILAQLGADIKGALQEEIRDWTAPENAPYTIEKKGFNNPLIDTGDFWKMAIEVETKKGMSDV